MRNFFDWHISLRAMRFSLVSRGEHESQPLIWWNNANCDGHSLVFIITGRFIRFRQVSGLLAQKAHQPVTQQQPSAFVREDGLLKLRASASMWKKRVQATRWFARPAGLSNSHWVFIVLCSGKAFRPKNVKILSPLKGKKKRLSQLHFLFSLLAQATSFHFHKQPGQTDPCTLLVSESAGAEHLRGRLLQSAAQGSAQHNPTAICQSKMSAPDFGMALICFLYECLRQP